MFTKKTFNDYGLSDELLLGIEKMGWSHTTPIQHDSIPYGLRGKNVIGQARTGSGKTGAFGIPILENCQPSGQLQALILTPTRELAQQVSDEMSMLQGDMGYKIVTVYGGKDLEAQAKKLDDGVDIIVGTPGRVMDMSKRGHLDLNQPSIFCLDEADRMLDMGFLPDIMWILERMGQREQTFLFSATFPQEILDISNQFIEDAEHILTEEEQLELPPVDLFSTRVSRTNKMWALSRLLDGQNEDGQTMIFCNTKRMVDLAVDRLKKFNYSVGALHGDMSQNQRDEMLNRFKNGKLPIIVATDVAARGIDVDGVTLVINYDLPTDFDSFIHRIGRTGRIGRNGVAWSLVSKDDAPLLPRICATYGLDIVESEPPEPAAGQQERIKKKEDYSESADVFGYITLQRRLAQPVSSLQAEMWCSEIIKCDPLLIGDIKTVEQKLHLKVHSSIVGSALKAFESSEFFGSVEPAIILE
ncbi:MAG: DEAD/DEAH box helicase [Candidatus Poseidoniales archaeon]